MTRQALEAGTGETRRGSIGEANDIAVGRQADAPNTLVTPSLLSDSREAMARKLASFDHNSSVPEYNEEAIDRLWPSYLPKVDALLSLPQTGVDAASDLLLLSHVRLRCALEQIASGGLGTNDQTGYREAVTIATNALASCLTPKVIDRDIEGETIERMKALPHVSAHDDPGFVAAWSAMESLGYQYSDGNIEKVHLGWQIARALASPSLHGDGK